MYSYKSVLKVWNIVLLQLDGYDRIVRVKTFEQAGNVLQTWMAARVKRVFSVCGRLSARKRMRRQSGFAGCYSNTTKRRRLGLMCVHVRFAMLYLCTPRSWFFFYESILLYRFWNIKRVFYC